MSNNTVHQTLSDQPVVAIFTAGKQIGPKDNQANIKNPNKGTPGTNRQYDQAQGNRGKQLNPNHKKPR